MRRTTVLLVLLLSGCTLRFGSSPSDDSLVLEGSVGRITVSDENASCLTLTTIDGAVSPPSCPSDFRPGATARWAEQAVPGTDERLIAIRSTKGARFAIVVYQERSSRQLSYSVVRGSDVRGKTWFAAVLPSSATVRAIRGYDVHGHAVAKGSAGTEVNPLDPCLARPLTNNEDGFLSAPDPLNPKGPSIPCAWRDETS
jgi:hypothetical protein